MSGRPAAEPTLWAERAAVRRARIAEVAVRVPVYRTYSFAVPEEMVERVQPGCRVRVPLGRGARPTLGLCLRVSEGEWDSTLQPVIEVIDDEPVLSEELVALGRWVSEYYCAPPGLALAALVPEAAARRAGFRRRRYVCLAGQAEGLSGRAAEVVGWLAAAGGEASLEALVEATGVSPGTVRSLAKRGVVRVVVRKEPAAAPEFARPRSEPEFALTPAQQAALEQITAWVAEPTFRVGVLYGVSGSGKTEVYIRAAREAVARGGQAIVLVPEIALTTQALERLARRFDRVAVLHSGLSERERSLLWHEIASGRRRVVVGTRSAVFAPCADLRLIVVDEEQEPSYKNQQTPRFHARDVAIWRGHQRGVPVVLGSATPSLETWLNVRRLKHYALLELPERVQGLPLPAVEVVDMREEHRARRGIHLLSRRLEEALGAVLEAGLQAVLLLNRRGYASLLFCPVCRTRVVCPQCNVNLVFHKSEGLARCHYCSARMPIPRHCPDNTCGHRLVQFGMGTQRVEEELQRKFPSARIARADSDVLTRPEAYASLLGRFERQEFDVLVGTQMIAKGLDFPAVALAGVVAADVALALPDFRAGERTFQLLTQLAGRAGRSVRSGGERARVIIQTFTPDLDAVRTALEGDYGRFAAGELQRRHRLALPPYARLVRFVVADVRQSRARQEAERLAAALERVGSREGTAVRCFGPYPCAVARIRNRYRYEVLLRGPAAGPVQQVLRAAREEGILTCRAQQFAVDVDPVDLQ